MTAHAAQWKAAKAHFFKIGLTGEDIPPDFVLSLSQGYDFGPALKKFDSVTAYEKRLKAGGPVMKAAVAYQKDIKGALRTSTTAGKKGLNFLNTTIDAIMREVEAETQEPRPSGRMAKPFLLKDFDLVAGIPSEYLVLKPVIIKVQVEIDEMLQGLIDRGEVKFREMVLLGAAEDTLVDLRKRFSDTIKKVNESIRADPSIYDEKTKEANEVLQYYGKIVEDRVTQAVKQQWDVFIANKAYLREFRIKAGVKIALTTIGTAVAVTSAVLSFGTAWLNIFAAVKGVLEIAKTIKTLTAGIDDVRDQLNKDIKHINELNLKREKAKAKGEGQKASKSKEAAKELLAAIMPFTKDMMKTRSSIEARVNQYSGLISKVEASADKVAGQFKKVDDNLAKMPHPHMLNTFQRIDLADMRRMRRELAEQLIFYYESTREANRFATAARKAVQELKAKDSWTGGGMETTGNWGSRGTALYALANFAFACAEHGKSLIPL